MRTRELSIAVAVGVVLLVAAAVANIGGAEGRVETVIKLATTMLGFATAVAGAVRGALGASGLIVLSNTETAGAVLTAATGAVLLVVAQLPLG